MKRSGSPSSNRPGAQGGKQSSKRAHSQHLKDPRFLQLLQAANEGDENAIADLFREFNFKFGEEAL